MASLERKSMSKSTKDLTGNDLPDLEDISSQNEKGASTVKTDIDKNTTDDEHINEINNRVKPESKPSSPTINVNMDKLMDQYWTNIDASDVKASAVDTSEEVVKKLVIPKYLNFKPNNKDTTGSNNVDKDN